VLVVVPGHRAAPHLPSIHVPTVVPSPVVPWVVSRDAVRPPVHGWLLAAETGQDVLAVGVAPQGGSSVLHGSYYNLPLGGCGHVKQLRSAHRGTLHTKDYRDGVGGGGGGGWRKAANTPHAAGVTPTFCTT
jgi:hypothetical protein